MKPLILETPIRLEASFMQSASADRAAEIPGVLRINGRTLVYEDTDMLRINRLWRLMLNVGFIP